MENVGHAVLQCSHRRINEGFSSQSFPRDFDIDSPTTVMEWSGVVQLGRPMRIFEVKLFRYLGEPCELRNCSSRVLPLDFESNPLSISYRSAVGFLNDVEKIRTPFRFLSTACGPVSCGQS